MADNKNNIPNENEELEAHDTVTFYDEEGNEYEFDLIDYIDYNDKLYAVLIPSELYDDDDGSVVIMETVFENNEPRFEYVEDDELAQKILDEFAARGGVLDNEEENQ